MKAFVIAALGAMLTFGVSASTGSSSASSNGANTQGAGLGPRVQCTYPDGTQMYVPIGYCELIGGKHKAYGNF
ncbi:hypothetical protein HGP28_01720 [Vibrio sp. SM6]|uniref:DUF333 domain-containing protein n=1 Tax=Vibrio agarilyticus TaxID=2726741 RepID=A0A7X8TP59_9VIBR|nr:hypothetical protein [Vibrio agarilyticus]NLS11608.1 hypothetical protein [Vibrio agarilyticus]